MPQDALRDEIFAMPVWDTHNHLDSSAALSAQSIWDVGHYFWFHRELQGVGYPSVKDAMELPETDRAEAFAEALQRGRNTTWNRLVRRTLADLWGVRISDGASVLRASAAIAETAADPRWPETVCERIKLATLTVGAVPGNGLEHIRHRLCLMGSVTLPSASVLDGLRDAEHQRDATIACSRDLETQVAAMAADGRRVFRTEPPCRLELPALMPRHNAMDDIIAYLRHVLFQALNRHRCHVQLFLGMERPSSERHDLRRHEPFALNDPTRIAGLHQVFAMYGDVSFELVNAAQLSHLDIVQAARIYANVVPGGLWWFSFRPSNYREIMQYRLEALPACRATFLASDARCIEWAYCKTLLVKELLAGFLTAQVRDGWLDREAACYVAREWLHDAAARLYRGEDDD